MSISSVMNTPVSQQFPEATNEEMVGVNMKAAEHIRETNQTINENMIPQ